MTVPSKHFVFVLRGRAVQGVKLRRYVESAGRHFGVGGFVVNTPQGHVYGECCCFTQDTDEGQESLRGFLRWLSGKWNPVVLTNIKPTPVGTAYPVHAIVDSVVIRPAADRYKVDIPGEYLKTFTMVRDEETTVQLLLTREHIPVPEEVEEAAAWRW